MRTKADENTPTVLPPAALASGGRRATAPLRALAHLRLARRGDVLPRDADQLLAERSKHDSFPLAPSNTYGRNTVDDSLLRQALEVIFGGNHWHADHPLLRGDPASVAVLVELLNDDDPQVKMIAAKGLGTVGTGARSALPELRRESAQAFGLVRDLAAEAVRRIDPD